MIVDISLDRMGTFVEVGGEWRKGRLPRAQLGFASNDLVWERAAWRA